jgi:hypothetical protein
VLAAQRAVSLDVLVAGFAAGRGGDVIEGALDVDRVVDDDRADDQAERAELLFLTRSRRQRRAPNSAATCWSSSGLGTAWTVFTRTGRRTGRWRLAVHERPVAIRHALARTVRALLDRALALKAPRQHRVLINDETAASTRLTVAGARRTAGLPATVVARLKPSRSTRRPLGVTPSASNSSSACAGRNSSHDNPRAARKRQKCPRSYA